MKYKDKLSVINDLICSGNDDDNEGWIVVYVCDQVYEAEMLKANLRGAGIDSIILTQKDSSYPMPGNLSIVKLLVKRSDYQTALDIIKNILGEDNKHFEE